jgi:hypothetical protein
MNMRTVPLRAQVDARHPTRVMLACDAGRKGYLTHNELLAALQHWNIGATPRLPPPSRTNWTRLVPPSVLTGHVLCAPALRESTLRRMTHWLPLSSALE